MSEPAQPQQLESRLSSRRRSRALSLGRWGGGGGGAGGIGGNGGSGIVVLRYPNTFTITVGAGLTGSTATVGANKVTTITAGTGNVSWV